MYPSLITHSVTRLASIIRNIHCDRYRYEHAGQRLPSHHSILVPVTNMGCSASKTSVVQPTVEIVRTKSGSLGTNKIERKKSEVAADNAGTSETLYTTSKRRNGSICLYNAATADSNTKDQDRFITIPELFPNVFFTGVFDGHGQNGAVFAERAGTECARLLRQKMAWLQEVPHLPEQHTAQTIDALKTRATVDLTTIFADVQQTFTLEYKKEIQIPLEKEHAKLEKSEGIALPMALPMVGGTTATLVLVVGAFVITSWVGDSRAVLCRVIESTNDEGGGNTVVTAVDLTIDHNVESNVEEKNRAIAAGGAIAGRHVAVDGADGMLQVLRSLGDVPHHANNIVSCVPEVHLTQLVPEENPFIVAASDGIWHHRTSLEVVENIFNALNKKVVESGELLDSDDLVRICQGYEYDLNGWVKANAKNKDDIVMSTFTVNGFDWRKRK